MPPELPADERPSKSARKRDAHALQRLGAELAGLPPAALDAVAMPETLREALRELQRTRSHEGRRRQTQLVGKLMRAADPEPLRDAVARARLPGAHETLALHRAEQWRRELAADDDAVARWCAAYPAGDHQRLRNLVRQARADAALPPETRHGRAWRELFRLVRATLAEASDADGR